MNEALPTAVIMEEPDPLIQKIIEIMGVDGIIEAVGLGAIIEAVGLERIIECFDADDIFIILKRYATEGTPQQRQHLLQCIEKHWGEAH